MFQAELLFGPALRRRSREFEAIAKILDRFFVDREPGGEFVIRNARNLLFHIRLDGTGVLAFVLDAPDFILEIEQPQFFHFDPDGIDRRQVIVAGFEIAGARTKKTDRRVTSAFEDLYDLDKVRDFLDPLFRADHRQFRNMDAISKTAFIDRQSC
jgi:hypothetical protein